MSEKAPLGVSRTVFVLGAGFTRAFAPAAPLMVDDYDGDRLEADFERFTHAAFILALERRRNPDRKINIESLMTRLDGRMPYDFREQGATDEMALLLSKLKDAFLKKIKFAKERDRHTDALMAFARYCVEKGIDCITFNYDDLFDEALWLVKGLYDIRGVPSDFHFWHPDSGYGFFCRPATSILEFDPLEMQPCTILLLKLHGSINWRVRSGYREPYAIDALTHYEEWYPPPEIPRPSEETVELHLERESFIIPPTLHKSALVDQPVLRTIWSVANDVLSEAKEVVFVGYSLPITDIAAATLFSEGILGNVRVKVVSLATDEASERRVREAYRRVFSSRIADDDFYFRGALEWAHGLT